MSRRNSRSLLSSPAAQSPKREISPASKDKDDKDEKRGQRRNKLFRRIQMDIKVQIDCWSKQRFVPADSHRQQQKFE